MRTHGTRPQQTAITPLSAEARQAILHSSQSSRSPLECHDAAILALALEAALRAHEVCALTVDDVERDSEQHDQLRVQGKDGRERRVLLGRETTHVLRTYLRDVRSLRDAEERALFLTPTLHHLDMQAAGDIVRTAGARAGLVEPLTIHRLRQTAISDLWNARRQRQGEGEDSTPC